MVHVCLLRKHNKTMKKSSKLRGQHLGMNLDSHRFPVVAARTMNFRHFEKNKVFRLKILDTLKMYFKLGSSKRVENCLNIFPHFHIFTLNRYSFLFIIFELDFFLFNCCCLLGTLLFWNSITLFRRPSAWFYSSKLNRNFKTFSDNNAEHFTSGKCSIAKSI